LGRPFKELKKIYKQISKEKAYEQKNLRRRIARLSLHSYFHPSPLMISTKEED
jgi:hypothetical protein